MNYNEDNRDNFDNTAKFEKVDNGVVDLNSFLGNADKKEKREENLNFFQKLLKKIKGIKFNKATFFKAALTVFLVGVITVCIIAGAFIIYAFNFVDASMDENLYDVALNFTTTIYVEDEKTGEFTEYQRLHGEHNRIWVSDSKGEIPENLKNAFIAIEDQRFKTHNGVDWKRTFSAFANLFFHFYSSNQGGSTITQQLVKNLTGDNSTSPSRKVREIMRARELEIKYSKDIILECYINTVAMAGGMYGSEVASNYYFDKSTKDLTLSECAALAAIVKAPEEYRPDKKPERNKQRRQTVLNKMLELGYISEEEHAAAYDEELNIVAKKENLNEVETNSYFVDALFEDVVKGLVENYGYSEEHAKENFYNGGYKIYATLDPDIQSAMESVYEDTSYAHKGKDGKLLQGSMVVLDYNGHVKGLVGGIGEKSGNLVFNRATAAFRQPGSTIKPMSAYAPAIEANLITYSSLVSDRDEYNYKSGDGTMWKPKNWYGGHLGDITVEKALEKSVNTIPVMLVEKLTPKVSYTFLTEKLNLKTLNQHDLTSYASLGMGGTNTGITTLQEAAAFATFGNGGLYYEPITYYKVTNQRGDVILENETTPRAAMSEDTATVMNHLLQNVVYGEEGTGAGAASSVPHMKIYAKTGTSNDSMNCWFTGGTPYYVASSWCGYDTLQTVKQSSTARQMWCKVMSKIHSKLPAKQFTDSQDAQKHYFCVETGLLATEGCTNRREGWYRESNVPALCTTHTGEKATGPYGEAASEATEGETTQTEN